jgi:hypothetical protein
MEDACVYGVVKFAILLTFVFVIWSVGMWDEWGNEDPHNLMGHVL